MRQPRSTGSAPVRRAGTTRGNHDSRIFAYMAQETEQNLPSQLKLDGELGSYRTLSVEQLEFVVELPDQLIVRWQNTTISILHGHQPPRNPDYTNWRTAPDQLMELFHDSQVALTIIGHMHYPFVRQRDASWLANSGSVAAPINRWRNTGPIQNRCAADNSVPDDDAHCSFLRITEDSGAMAAEIASFDYDRCALLDRYAHYTDLSLPTSLRKLWNWNAFFDLKEMAAG